MKPPFPIDTYYASTAKIGTDKPYSRLRIDVYDAAGKKKLKELYTTAFVPYSSTRLPDSGNLRFRHLDESCPVALADYSWKDRKDTILQFQKPVVNTDMCSGFREDNVCTITKEGEITVATVMSTGMFGTKPGWWRTDMIYGDAFVTVQFGEMGGEEKREVVGAFVLYFQKKLGTITNF